MTRGHKFDDRHAHFLESKEREKILPREKVVDFIDSLFSLEGRIVADVGAGTGYFTFPLLRKAGKKGKVFAIDINEKLLAALESKASGIDNLEVVLSSEDHIPLDSESVDFAFCGDLLHELDGDATLRELYRILKPQGLFVAVDWEKGKSGMGPPDKIRMTRAEAKEFCEKAGFTFSGTFEPGKHHYGVVFRK